MANVRAELWVLERNHVAAPRDAYGVKAPDWRPIAEIWVWPLQSQPVEVAFADGTRTVWQHKLRMRYLEALTTQHCRLKTPRGTYVNIPLCVDTDGRRQWVETAGTENASA